MNRYINEFMDLHPKVWRALLYHPKGHSLRESSKAETITTNTLQE